MTKLRDIMTVHWPHGWVVYERTPINSKGQFKSVVGLVAGLTRPELKIIEVSDVVCRETLYVFLHECGHVNCGHFASDDEESLPLAQHEYEAETYAINAMRAGGLSVPRKTLKGAREYVRKCIEEEPDRIQTKEVLKFAYGSRWRQHC